MVQRQRRAEIRPDFQDVPDARRRNMAAIKGKNTLPELQVRKALHHVGYRFRLHGHNLPGRPDLVFAGRRSAIFVHGCFWHRHGCRYSALPKTRREWWAGKLAATQARDATAMAALEAAGWRCEVVWECECRADLPGVVARLERFLGPPGSSPRPPRHEAPYGRAE